jgi:hypothetical protein
MRRAAAHGAAAIAAAISHTGAGDGKLPPTIDGPRALSFCRRAEYAAEKARF